MLFRSGQLGQLDITPITMTGSTQEGQQKNVYKLDGQIITTKPAEKPEDRDKASSTMVYSNGTGAHFDPNTEVRMEKFSQQNFQPLQSSQDTEPSLTRTQAKLTRGTVALCNGKMVGGSVNQYEFPGLGSLNIRGTKVVMENGGDFVKKIGRAHV